MAHKVKCVYCGKVFDRDKVACVQVSNRRYAHKECSEGEMQRLSKEELDKQKLEEYIVKLLGADYVTARVHKQINQYVKEYNFTYSGIHKALVYFYEVQKHSTDKANGGIGTDVENEYSVADQVRLLTAEDSGFSKSGYHIKEWNTKSDGTGFTYGLNQSITLWDNLTLYAIWE